MLDLILYASVIAGLVWACVDQGDLKLTRNHRKEDTNGPRN